MTEGLLKLASFVRAPRASFTDRKRGRARQCAAHGGILHGPQGSLDQPDQPGLLFVFGSCSGQLRGAARSLTVTPDLLPRRRFIDANVAAFSQIWWEN